VLAAARRFAAAQLRWEAGDHTAATRATIRRLAVARVAREVLDGPPARSTPAGFAPAAAETVRSVDLSDAQSAGGGVAVVASVGDGSAVRAQRLVLQRRGGSWRTTSLG
jgi:hypothetical protein